MIKNSNIILRLLLSHIGFFAYGFLVTWFFAAMIWGFTTIGSLSPLIGWTLFPVAVFAGLIVFLAALICGAIYGLAKIFPLYFMTTYAGVLTYMILWSSSPFEEACDDETQNSLKTVFDSVLAIGLLVLACMTGAGLALIETGALAFMSNSALNYFDSLGVTD